MPKPPIKSARHYEAVALAQKIFAQMRKRDLEMEKVVRASIQDPRSRRPPNRKIVIRHVPFKTFLNEDECYGYFEHEFLNAEPTEIDLESFPGYAEYQVARKAIESLAVATSEETNGLAIFSKKLLLTVLFFLFEEVSHEDWAVEARELEQEGYESSPKVMRWLQFPITRTLVGLTRYLINKLDGMRPEHLRYCAEEQNRWPCLVALTDLRSRSNLFSELRRLKLGSQSGSGRPNQNELNRICSIIIDTIKRNQRQVARLRKAQALEQSNPVKFLAKYQVEPFPTWALECADLPPLKQDGAWKEWFKIGWRAIMDATGSHPEKDQRLRPLGLYREFHGTIKGAKLPDGTKSANIREGIEDALARAFGPAALFPAKLVHAGRDEKVVNHGNPSAHEDPSLLSPTNTANPHG
jgi:hypothetical protein